MNLRDDLLQLYSDSDDEEEDEEEEEEEEGEEEAHEGPRDQDQQHDHPYGAPKPYVSCLRAWTIPSLSPSCSFVSRDGTWAASLSGELLELADPATLLQYGEALGTGIHHPPPHADSHRPVARPPKVESQHRCPQLEALQQKLKLLEKENNHLREEVRTGRKVCPLAGSGDSLAPSSFPSSRPLTLTTWKTRSRCSSWNAWSSFVRDAVIRDGAPSQGVVGRIQGLETGDLSRGLGSGTLQLCKRRQIPRLF